MCAPHPGGWRPRLPNAHARRRESKDAAVVRVVKPRVGMGLEFLDIDPDSNATRLAWIESLRKSS